MDRRTAPCTRVGKRFSQEAEEAPCNCLWKKHSAFSKRISLLFQSINQNPNHFNLQIKFDEKEAKILKQGKYNKVIYIFHLHDFIIFKKVSEYV